MGSQPGYSYPGFFSQCTRWVELKVIVKQVASGRRQPTAPVPPSDDGARSVQFETHA